jgi:hypothetical protein
LFRGAHWFYKLLIIHNKIGTNRVCRAFQSKFFVTATTMQQQGPFGNRKEFLLDGRKPAPVAVPTFFFMKLRIYPSTVMSVPVASIPLLPGACNLHVCLYAKLVAIFGVPDTAELFHGTGGQVSGLTKQTSNGT